MDLDPETMLILARIAANPNKGTKCKRFVYNPTTKKALLLPESNRIADCIDAMAEASTYNPTTKKALLLESNRIADYFDAMAGASHAAYFDNPYRSDEIGYLQNLHIFERGTCRGFVGSNNNVVVVAFRGTNNRFNSLDHIIQTAQQWLRNLAIFQNDHGGGIRVHAGFDEDLFRVYDDVGNLIVHHGGHHKPVIVTGHSAGAAIATLAAQRYKVAGLNIHSAYVFASPRVGNRAFANAYDVPLFRIENMDDLVPHVPLPPLAMEAIDFVVDTLADILRPVFPNLVPSLAGQYEYVHAGKLFFIDWNGDLLYSHRVVEYIEDWLERTFGGEPERLPGSPIPKWKLDAARAAATVESIYPQITRGTFAFFRHHPMIHHLKCVRELLYR